jgi:hypothetical protein
MIDRRESAHLYCLSALTPVFRQRASSHSDRSTVGLQDRAAPEFPKVNQTLQEQTAAERPDPYYE